MISPLDLIFPKTCVGCQGEGSWFCLNCFEPLLKTQPILHCPDCSTVTNGTYCPTHRPNHEIDGLIIAHPFHSGTLREAIHNLKYNGIRELSCYLGQILGKSLENYPSEIQKAIVIPIPLHPQRQIERGFNQAELIARQLNLNARTDIVIRYRLTKTQASLTHEQRLTNLTNVFGVRANKAQIVNGQTILLVDDVATTGSTLDAAALVLKKAGARSVWGAVLGKG